MDFSGGITGDRGFHRDWWRSGDRFVELEPAGGVRMAANYLLAGHRTVRSLPDSVRRPGYACLSSFQYAAANQRAHGRALGADDARGAREVSGTLLAIRAAECQADGVSAGRKKAAGS